MESCCATDIRLQLYKLNFRDLLYDIVPIVNDKVLCT